jgi:hypothetical protein
VYRGIQVELADTALLVETTWVIPNV